MKRDCEQEKKTPYIDQLLSMMSLQPQLKFLLLESKLLIYGTLQKGENWLFGGAGVGRQFPFSRVNKKYCNRAWRVFRFWELENGPEKGNDLYAEMTESGVIDKTTMVFGKKE
ncbi:MAG: hypothetical protein CM15mP4_2660 [Candidatus Neomarinimicrobiota bacterium]|nr:MAG: hypothetical protein CM15mP4_2660 [Candidatus Neomarinimicrobiota bacterium]